MSHGQKYRRFITVVFLHVMLIFYMHSDISASTNFIFLTETYFVGIQKSKRHETICLKSVFFWTYDLI